MIDGLVAGRVFAQAAERADKTGSTFVVCKVVATSNDGDSLMVNVIAFQAEVCAALLELNEGDSVALAGSLTPRVWSDKQGQARPSLDMVAQRILTAFA